MSFISIEFWGLFVLFFVFYWGLHAFVSLQKIILLLASYAIVAGFAINFAIILAVYTLVIYTFSILIERYPQTKVWFVLSLSASVSNLAVFKYFDFFRTEMQGLLDFFAIDYALPVIEILMPIGISFYTFHSISYLVSIKKQEIQRPSLLNFALFVSFFPSIIAGPINRAKDFLPQINRREPKTLLDANKAFMLICIAMVKVVCLSPLLDELWVTPIFENVTQYHSLMIVLATYSYALLIYLNFSGYTELVTGIALLLGYRLPKNFDHPYVSVNLREFWQRWHISLSTFIRDYIYIPLGGSKKGATRTQINLLIAMLLSGLWHGASVNFIIWGGIHGVGMVLFNIYYRICAGGISFKYSDILGRLITFHYVCLGWIFFRCATPDDAGEFIAAIFNNTANTLQTLSINNLLFLMFLSISFIFYPMVIIQMKRMAMYMINTNKLLISLSIIFIMMLTIILSPDGIPGFIYSRF